MKVLDISWVAEDCPKLEHFATRSGSKVYHTSFRYPPPIRVIYAPWGYFDLVRQRLLGWWKKLLDIAKSAK